MEVQADTGRPQGRGSSLAEAPPREGPGTPSNSSEFLQGSQTHGPHLRFLPQNCGVPSGRPQRPPLLIRHILEPAVASPVPSLETPPSLSGHAPGFHTSMLLPLLITGGETPLPPRSLLDGILSIAPGYAQYHLQGSISSPLQTSRCNELWLPSRLAQSVLFTALSEVPSPGLGPASLWNEHMFTE